jgi:hypothetical protein
MNKSTIIMLIFNGLSSILLGTMYLFHYWISFRFLGSEIGSESSITSLWASISIGIGIVLLITTIKDIRKIHTKAYRISIKLLIFLTSLNVLVQLPPLSLWIMFYFIDEISDQLIGVLTHLIFLCLLIINLYLVIRFYNLKSRLTK